MDGIFDKILAVYLAWMVLSWKCIVCQNANLTANPEHVSEGVSITLTCMYIGTGNVDAIVWLNGSNTDSFSLTPGTTVPQCDVFSTVNASFDPSRLYHTCDKMQKNYTLRIYPVKAVDLNVKWSCTFLDPSPNPVYSVITIWPTATSLEPTSTNDNNTKNIIGGAVGGSVGGAALLAVGAGLYYKYKKKKKNGKAAEGRDHEAQNDGGKNGHQKEGTTSKTKESESEQQSVPL